MISPAAHSPTKQDKHRSAIGFKEMNHVEAIFGMDGLDREDPRLPRLLLQQARGSGLQVKTTPKERWLLVTDQKEAQDLISNGKYYPPTKPFWVRRAEQLWVVVDENFRAWREKRVQEGKNRCHENPMGRDL